jgi:hypothetical protein
MEQQQQTAMCEGQNVVNHHSTRHPAAMLLLADKIRDSRDFCGLSAVGFDTPMPTCTSWKPTGNPQETSQCVNKAAKAVFNMSQSRPLPQHLAAYYLIIIYSLLNY